MAGAAGAAAVAMSRSAAKNAAFICQFTSMAPDAACYRLRILGSELEALVLATMRDKARAVLGSVSDSTHQTAHDAQVTQIERARRTLYERLIRDEICAETFQAESAALDDELERLRRRKSAFGDGVVDIAQDVLAHTALCRSAVDMFFEKVWVFPDNRLEVEWRV